MASSLKELRDEYGMTIYEIKKSYPNVSKEDLRTAFELSEEQLKEELKKGEKEEGKSVQPHPEIKPLYYIDPKEKSELTKLKAIGKKEKVSLVSKERYAKVTEKTKAALIEAAFGEEALIESTFGEEDKKEQQRYLYLEKPKRPLQRRTGIIKESECPMASTQTILNRLAQIGVTPPATAPTTTKPPVTKLGPSSELSEKELLSAVKSGKEVELSLGRFYGDTFRPGVPVRSFISVCRYLGNTKNGFAQTESPYLSTLEIDDSTNVRRSTNKKGDFEYQEKIRGQIYNSPDLEFRISVSDETTIDEPPRFRVTTTRERYRTEFLNKAGTLRVDMSSVTQTKGRSTRHSYEIEIEMLVSKGKTALLVELVNEAKKLMMVAQEVSSPERLITRSEFSKFIAEHNYLLKNPSRDTLASDYWNKPTNLTKMDLLERAQEMAITPKLDGERRLLFLMDSGIYVNTRPDIYKIGHLASEKYVGTVLDSEYYEDTKTYWVFDVLIYKGKDLRTEYLPDRDIIRQKFLASEFGLWDGIQIDFSKPFYFPSEREDIYDCVRKAARWRSPLEHAGIKFDGFIYQSTREYGSPFSRKWKPNEVTTIDFLLTPTDQENYYTYTTRNSKTQQDIPFQKYGVSDKIYYRRPRICGINPDAAFVAECKYVPEDQKGHFEFYRERLDRMGANEEWVAEGVWKDITDPILLTGIFGYDLRLMQYAHNRTKELMLRRFQGASAILDSGTGQGGDLNKWSLVNIKKVFVIEPDEEKLAVLHNRYNPKKHPLLEVIKTSKGKPVGIEDTKDIITALAVGDAKIAGMSAFFSLTFLGKSKLLMEQAVETISSVLTQPGQKFIGIVMDGKQVHELLEQTDGKEYIATGGVKKHEIFSIKATGKTSTITSSFTSRQIRVNIPGTFIVDVEEWTFPFDFFAGLMKHNGFYLESEGYLSPAGDKKFPDLPLSAETTGGGIFVPKDTPVSRNVNNTYNNLPFNSKVFSSLQRYFVFTKGRKKEVKDITIPKKEEPVSLGDQLAGLDVEDLNLELHYVPQDNSAIFNAYLEADDDIYRNPSSEKIESLEKSLPDLQKNAKSTKRTEEDYVRIRKALKEVKDKLEKLPENKALKKEVRELEASLKSENRSEEDKFVARTKYLLAKDDLANTIQNERAQISKAFRTEELPKFIKEHKDLIPVQIRQRYGKSEILIGDLKDLRKEIPADVALTLITSLRGKRNLVGVLYNSLKGQVTSFGCPKDLKGKWTTFIVYQTTSKSPGQLPADERSSLLKQYYPVMSGDEGTFGPKDKSISELVKLGC